MASLHLIEKHVPGLVLCRSEVSPHALAHGPAWGKELMFRELAVLRRRLLRRTLLVE